MNCEILQTLLKAKDQIFWMSSESLNMKRQFREEQIKEMYIYIKMKLLSYQSNVLKSVKPWTY